MLGVSLNLESLNLFLYTWRYLSTLEQSAERASLKGFYSWFARITIVLLPASLYAVTAAYVIEFSRYETNLEKLNINVYGVYAEKASKLA